MIYKCITPEGKEGQGTHPADAIRFAYNSLQAREAMGYWVQHFPFKWSQWLPRSFDDGEKDKPNTTRLKNAYEFCEVTVTVREITRVVFYMLRSPNIRTLEQIHLQQLQKL